MEIKTITMLDGSIRYFEKVGEGRYREVEKKELIGGVFKKRESVFYITNKGTTTEWAIDEEDEYAIQQGRVWKTRAEAERKVETDNLIAKYRITDRALLEDKNITKCTIIARPSISELEISYEDAWIYGICFTEEGVEKIINQITYEEWTKYVLLWR